MSRKAQTEQAWQTAGPLPCKVKSVLSLWSATPEQQSCAARTRLSFLDPYIPNPVFPHFFWEKKKKKNLSLVSKSSHQHSNSFLGVTHLPHACLYLTQLVPPFREWSQWDHHPFVAMERLLRQASVPPHGTLAERHMFLRGIVKEEGQTLIQY